MSPAATSTPVRLQSARPDQFCLIFAPMVYKVIGLMSGSSLDGLDIAYVHLQEQAGKWAFEFVQTETLPYPPSWRERLPAAAQMSALDYQLLHTEYGRWLGEAVGRFIETHGLAYQVQLIASHGHTVFHLPARGMTAQLGDGAALAAVTGINVVSDLRAMDIALGGQGAPIVPAGERLLFSDYDFFLNLGGIANISRRLGARTDGDIPAGKVPAAVNGAFVAYDICPAGRVLDLLAAREGLSYDEGGVLAAKGSVNEELLECLNALPYYGKPYPKSLANAFGTDTIYPMIIERGLATADALRTYVEHIGMQTAHAVEGLLATGEREVAYLRDAPGAARRLLLTGGGAHNHFLTGRLRELLQPPGVEPIVPERSLIDFKEALVMALLGVLRWREENNVLASVTGARRDSIGGAVWMGQEV
jgi:anhydro-N-acetylmuramic acid kinase